MTHMLSEEPGISRDCWRLADEAVWRHCRRGPSAASMGLSEALGVGQRQGSVCVWQVMLLRVGAASARRARRPLFTPLSGKEGCWCSQLGPERFSADDFTYKAACPSSGQCRDLGARWAGSLAGLALTPNRHSEHKWI